MIYDPYELEEPKEDSDENYAFWELKLIYHILEQDKKNRGA